MGSTRFMPRRYRVLSTTAVAVVLALGTGAAVQAVRGRHECVDGIWPGLWPRSRWASRMACHSVCGAAGWHLAVETASASCAMVEKAGGDHRGKSLFPGHDRQRELPVR